MNTKQVAKYQISESFKMTNRGIVFTGFILEGTINFGDYIEFKAFNKVFTRKISGIESITFPTPKLTTLGLLIECKNEQEILELKQWKPLNSISLILKKE